MVLPASLRYTGMKQAELAARNSRSRTSSEQMSKNAKQLVVCVDNEGYPTSLETRKIYVAYSDAAAEKEGFLRVVDESGDDYLYPKTFFRPITLTETVKKAVLAA
jgi:hypothetical protein